MIELPAIDILATMMLSFGDIFVLICAGSAGLALILSFARQQQLFLRFWLLGLFALIVCVPCLSAKISLPDANAFPVGLFLPMSNLVAGLLLIGAVVALVAALVIRKRLAYGILS